MGDSMRSGFVICPYYRKDTPETICCEGVTQESKLLLRFATKAHKLRHMALFCESQYRMCELYRAVDQQYDTEE